MNLPEFTVPKQERNLSSCSILNVTNTERTLSDGSKLLISQYLACVRLYCNLQQSVVLAVPAMMHSAVWTTNVDGINDSVLEAAFLDCDKRLTKAAKRVHKNYVSLVENLQMFNATLDDFSQFRGYLTTDENKLVVNLYNLSFNDSATDVNAVYDMFKNKSINSLADVNSLHNNVIAIGEADSLLECLTTFRHYLAVISKDELDIILAAEAKPVIAPVNFVTCVSHNKMLDSDSYGSLTLSDALSEHINSSSDVELPHFSGSVLVKEALIYNEIFEIGATNE